MDIVQYLSQELEFKEVGVRQTMDLLDRGLSIHFIARYRKNQTGGMVVDQILSLKERYEYLKKIKEAKDKAISRLEELGKKDNLILSAIHSATTLADIKEIMTPYRSKKETRASRARDMGLQNIANLILGKEDGDLQHMLSMTSVKEPLKYALDIVAEESVNHPQLKRIAESHLAHSTFSIKYRQEKDRENKYKELIHLAGTVKSLSSHQVMAIFRARDEGAIRFRFNIHKKSLISKLRDQKVHDPPSKYTKYFVNALEDGMNRLLLPRAKRAVLAELKKNADNRAIEVFKQNLENLLLQPPIIPQVVMGIDPGFANGCKVAIIDEFGKLLGTTTVFPTPPRNEVQVSSEILGDLISVHQVEFIAIGDGTGSKEAFEFVKDMLKANQIYDVNFARVPETGASVYSASEVARKELPHIDIGERGAVSIARRVLDPLAELVKIDPRSLGIGQYQHDVDQKALEDALDFIVDKCVNLNGVYIKNASSSLLEHIAGLNSTLAHRIVEYQQDVGFRNLNELYEIEGIGEKTFEEASGFIRIIGSQEVLDMTLIHPDHYSEAREIIELTGKNVFSWNEAPEDERFQLLSNLDLEKISDEYNLDLSMLNDIIEELILFGRDPRGIKEFVDLSKSPSSIDELEKKMVLVGEVRNVVDFGCFVDLGIKENGLVHISNMADRYISDTHEVIKVGDHVKVEVIEVDIERGRIGLRLLEVNGLPP